MSSKPHSARILIYSHDTFGLGHLRRCRTIAHSLVSQRKCLSILILSGSPIIGSFDFRARVDFVRIPGVIKLRNGSYSSLSLHLDLGQVLAMRASIIQHTAKIFAPDILLVDKEPFGLRGEIRNTLQMLKNTSTRLVLGLRDILDDPVLLAREWNRKKSMPALEELYDDVLIYGLPQVYEPLTGLPLSQNVQRKLTYTGYLRTHLPDKKPVKDSKLQASTYLLVTTGGGRDGELLIDWVLSAYESSKPPPQRALIVFGPFMQPTQQRAFERRIACLEQLQSIAFDAHIEHLIANASAIVSMGGYNTFCDILTFDKPALLVPRRSPRLEQYLRAFHADRLGMVRLLSTEQGSDPVLMANILSQLPQQQKPSAAAMDGLLDGLSNLRRLFYRWLD